MGFRGPIVPLPPFTSRRERCKTVTRHVYLGDVKHGEERTQKCTVCELKTRVQVK